MIILKEDIIHDVISKMKLDRNTARNLVELILKHIKEILASSDRVMISGLGYFKVVHKKARIGRIPKMKVSFEISERKVVAFSHSKILRKEMNANAF
jgi:nucleoid DNA-binding protein